MSRSAHSAGYRIFGFLLDREGTIAIKFALLVPVLIVSVGGAIDYSMLASQKSQLQAAADAGSIAAAKELGLADFKSENVNAIVSSVVQEFLSANHESPLGRGTVTTISEVRTDPLEVDVTATQNVKLTWGGLPGLEVSEITARSVARIVGRPNICVLGLDDKEEGTISLEDEAHLTGKQCSVFSNSKHGNGIASKHSSYMQAELICSAGGKEGGHGSFSPTPLTDCPEFDDPLADRPEPEVGACLEKKLEIVSETRELEPGTYCDGLRISNGSKVKLKPGTYVFSNGPLEVLSGSELSGEYVGLFFKGTKATFEFANSSSISLTAPMDGPMAGLLVFEARGQPKNSTHKILSNDARVLLGTLYLPSGELMIDADEPIADQSAYTAIVARAMRLYGGPHLVLNTNYNLTPIPVPAGIRGTGQAVSLVK